MRLDDRAGNRKSDTNPARFGCVETFEKPIDLVRTEPNPVILDGNDHGFGALAPLNRRSDRHTSRPPADPAQGFHGIGDYVHHDLLQLYRVTYHQRWRLCEFGTNDDPLLLHRNIQKIEGTLQNILQRDGMLEG